MPTRNLFVLLIVALLATVAIAIPNEIQYQGKLTDAVGVGMNGDFEMSFRIFDAPTGGAALWTEVHEAPADEVTVTKGLFDVLLGSITPIALDFSVDYWLEITVEGIVLLPRVKLSSSPYAYRAAIADSVVGGSAVGDTALWQVHVTDPLIFPKNNTNVLFYDDGEDMTIYAENALATGTGTSVIYGYANGSSTDPTSWLLDDMNSAVKGYVDMGENYSAGVAGFYDGWSSQTAAVLGAYSNGADELGALGYYDGTNFIGVYGRQGISGDYAGWFEGNFHLEPQTAPFLPVLGDIYADDVTNKAYFFNGTDWVDMTATPGAGSSQWTDHAVDPYIYANNNANAQVWDAGEDTLLMIDNSGVGAGTAIAARGDFAGTVYGYLGYGNDLGGHPDFWGGAGVYGRTDGWVDAIYGYASDGGYGVLGVSDGLDDYAGVRGYNANSMTNGRLATQDFGGEFDPGILLIPGTAPSAVEGAIYADDTDNKLYFYDGTSWVDLTAGGGADADWDNLIGYLQPTDANEDVLPNLSGNLGSSTAQWDTLFPKTIWFDNAGANEYIYFNGGDNFIAYVQGNDLFAINNDFVPDYGDSFDLGHSAWQWRDLYVDGVAHIDSIELGGVTRGSWPSGAGGCLAEPNPATLLINGDDLGVDVPLGFTFRTPAGNFTNAYVNTNGLLCFGFTSTSLANSVANLRNLTTPSPSFVIAPYWEDLIGDVYGEYRTGPERYVFYWDARDLTNTSYITKFQCVIYPDGGIIVHYIEMNDIDNDGGGTIGWAYGGASGTYKAGNGMYSIVENCQSVPLWEFEVAGGSGGGVGGSGTVDYIPLWTPDGSTLGDSRLQQNATTTFINDDPMMQANFSVYTDEPTDLHAIFGSTLNGSTADGSAWDFFGSGGTGVMGMLETSGQYKAGLHGTVWSAYNANIAGVVGSNELNDTYGALSYYDGTDWFAGWFDGVTNVTGAYQDPIAGWVGTGEGILNVSNDNLTGRTYGIQSRIPYASNSFSGAIVGSIYDPATISGIMGAMGYVNNAGEYTAVWAYDNTFSGPTSYALWAKSTNSAGYAGWFEGNFHLEPRSTAIALEGNLHANSTDNKLYYYDGTSWVDLTAGGGGGVGGSGTANWIPLWTPDGTTLGDSKIRDEGTYTLIHGLGLTPIKPGNFSVAADEATDYFGLWASNFNGSSTAGSAWTHANIGGGGLISMNSSDAKYFAGIFGFNWSSAETTAAVVGADNNSSNFGALAYRANSKTWAGYFSGDILINSDEDTTNNDYIYFGNDNHFLVWLPWASSFVFSNHVGPDWDRRFDLGTSSFRWRDVYARKFVADSIELGGVTRGDWPSGGAGLWTDAGTYLSANTNTLARVYDEGQPYGLYYQGSNRYGLYGGTSNATAGASGVYGYSSTSTAGTGYGYNNSITAVKGHCLYGNAYHFGVQGDTYSSDGSPTAGVIGTFIDETTIWGALAYKHTDASIWAGYFNGDVAVDNGNLNIKQNGLLIELTAGEALAVGDVVAVSTTANLTVVKATSGSELVIGVVAAAAGVGTPVKIAVGGVVQVRTSAAVTRANFARVGTTAGQAIGNGTSGSSGDFGIFLETTSGAGLAWMMFKKAEVF